MYCIAPSTHDPYDSVATHCGIEFQIVKDKMFLHESLTSSPPAVATTVVDVGEVCGPTVAAAPTTIGYFECLM